MPEVEMPVVTDLPDDYLTGIGCVIIEYAYLENLLGRIIYDLLGVEPAAGRLAVREPRVTDRLTVILDLAELRDIDLSAHKTDLLRRSLELCAAERDRLAHGVWVREPDTNELMLRVTRGKWRKHPEPEQGQKAPKRSILPEGRPYPMQHLNEVAELICRASRHTAQIRSAIQTAIAS